LILNHNSIQLLKNLFINLVFYQAIALLSLLSNAIPVTLHYATIREHHLPLDVESAMCRREGPLVIELAWNRQSAATRRRIVDEIPVVNLARLHREFAQAVPLPCRVLSFVGLTIE